MVILTVEAIEAEAQRLLEILERKLELMDAFRDNLITEQEMEDALLLLSLRTKQGGKDGGLGSCENGSGDGGNGDCRC